MVPFKGGDSPKLSKSEQEVLYYITKEFLTAKQIAIRRKTSISYTNRIIRSLKKKGVLKLGNVPYETKVPKKLCPLEPFKKIRLHAQEFNIKIIYQDHRYKQTLNKCNMIDIDGNTIRLYKNSLEVYSNTSFYGENVQKVTGESLKYFQKLFRRLEHDLKIIIVKPRNQNIKLVRHHYAEINNELAKDCNVKAETIKIYSTDDNKLWFMIDNSFNLHEAETTHTNSAKEDMEEIVRPFFNDLRDNRPPTLSEVMASISKVIEINKETASGLNAVVTLLKTQLETPQQKSVESELPNYIG